MDFQIILATLSLKVFRKVNELQTSQRFISRKLEIVLVVLKQGLNSIIWIFTVVFFYRDWTIEHI